MAEKHQERIMVLEGGFYELRYDKRLFDGQRIDQLFYVA